MNFILSRAESIERAVHHASGILIAADTCLSLAHEIGDLLKELRSFELPEVNSRLSTSYQAPLTQTDENGHVYAGRPSYIITEEQLRFLQSCGFTGPMMANIFGTSLSTVERRLRKYGIQLYGRYTEITDASLDLEISSLIKGNWQPGPNAIRSRLLVKNIWVPRQRVRDSMLRVDPAGAACRAMSSKLQRRHYRVSAPLSLYHIDGNHKLIR